MELWQAVLSFLICALLGGACAWFPLITKPSTVHTFEAFVPKVEICRPTTSWACFSVGVRAESIQQHTLGHQNCPACEGRKQKAMQVHLSPSLCFHDAAEQWKESRREQLSPGSLRNYEDYIKALTRFFGQMRLDQIHIGHIEEYQDLRKTTCGPSRLNHEISCLQQILKRAGLWTEIQKYYEPLKLGEPNVGMALEPEEEEYLFKVASSKKRWKVAYLCGVISNNTTAGPKELLHLKIGNIFLDRNPPCFVIESGVKNKYRVRPIPLNESARWAMSELLEMASTKGAYLPNHYLIPGRPRRLPQGVAEKHKSHYDPLRPSGSYRKAWDSLRKEAGKKFPRLLTLRRYDLRHNASTKLLEDPRVSERTIEELMGHRLNSRTKERYSHIRMQRKLAAVEILENSHLPDKKPPQVIKGLSSSTISFLWRK